MKTGEEPARWCKIMFPDQLESKLARVLREIPGLTKSYSWYMLPIKATGCFSPAIIIPSMLPISLSLKRPGHRCTGVLLLTASRPRKRRLHGMKTSFYGPLLHVRKTYSVLACLAYWDSHWPHPVMSFLDRPLFTHVQYIIVPRTTGSHNQGRIIFILEDLFTSHKLHLTVESIWSA